MTDAPRTGWARPLAAGLIGTVLLVGGVGGWFASASIAGAVIAPGAVVVRGKPKSIQHLDGGIVREIAVDSGDHVETGAVLIRLDGTTIRANLEIYNNRLREALAREARLTAELRDDARIDAADVRAVPLDAGDLSRALATQQNLLEARRKLRLGELDQLAEQLSQHENQIKGLTGLIAAREEQAASIEKELGAVRKMRERGYVPENQVLSLERQRADIRGQIAEYRAEIARVRNAIGETRVEILQVGREHQETVLKELRTVSTEIDELQQQIEATRAQLARIDILAPVAGVVHELVVHTVGGVIAPGATIAQIIPLAEGIEIEVSVPTEAIDQVSRGQLARVRFPGFNQRTTPEIEGVVTMISPSSVVNETSGETFYRVEVEVSAEELAKISEHRLAPGMPVEAFLVTERRTVIDYLVRPMSDFLTRAFRER